MIRLASAAVAAVLSMSGLGSPTAAGDWTEPDHIQLYEITGDQAVAQGQSLEFSGPVLALWPADDGKSARSVSRNPGTGFYEASIVSVTCGD